ncbi:hypothetical protein EDD37DRAFT_502697 [Exophiala viscosa]|uniref:uncharacterized protein n=1 Tax=Exophiala viscosa TaxID=2486360 RepID=UPI002193203D|nr:hypothetical protein EDD37DRAFT_502697 [Exophiala viscosa]
MQRTNTSRPQSREHTSSARVGVRANDHAHPLKRRKVHDPREEGHSTTTAIPLDDSQITEDSPDELQLSPDVKSGQSSGILRRRDESQRGKMGSHKTPAEQAHETQRASSELERASPKDESQFTKMSAKQRREEKDGILRSSSPTPLGQKTPAVAKSPYFSKPGALAAARRKGQIPNHTRVLQQESPDALQDDDAQFGRTPPANGPTNSYSSMGAKERIAPLIAGKKRDSVAARPENTRTSGQPEVNSWNLREIIGADLPVHPIYVVQVDENHKMMLINTNMEQLGNEPLFRQSLEKLIGIRYASKCNIVRLEFSRSSDHLEAKSYLRFESEKPAWDFVTLLLGLLTHLRLPPTDTEWLEDALAKAKENPPRITRRGDMSLPSHASKEQPTKTSTAVKSLKAHTGEKLGRLIDRLDARRSTPLQRTVITGHERSGLEESKDQHTGSVDQGSSQDISMKRKQTEVSLPTRRVTRSRDHNEALTSEHILTESRPKPKLSEREVLGDPWKNDLAYPVSDKKVAIVPFEDLRRLNDDEYLNDNLISFFVQYLEAYLEKTNVAAWRRIYFFNSYFFDTLTRTPKGKKGINYQGVSKWTKNLNLFKRDFVVVPVNENFHWYLAIICNLQYFIPEAEREAAGQVDEDDTPADQPGEQPKSHTEETQKSLAELSISDSETGQQNKAQSKKGRGRRKSGPLRKYDINKPVIITLDSLGTPRSATCSILKQYIAAEAENKLGLVIDTGHIQGMTAKQIPTQSNFSDCGLYLCMYLEQFVADPDGFVYRILRRVESAQQWPEKIYSHELRSRLRDLLLELHRRQENEESRMDVPGVSGIMIQKKLRPPEEAVSGIQPTREEIGAARSRYHTVVDDSNASPPVNIKHSEDAAKRTGEPSEKCLVADEDHSDVQAQNQRLEVPDATSEARPRKRPENGRDVKEEGFTHSTPAQCAAQLREQTHERESRKKMRIDHNDDARRRARSVSASTDFLTGTESYIASGTPPFLPDGHAGRREESPEVVHVRRVSAFEATHGRRKRKRQSEEPHNEVEQAKPGSDTRTEIPETQESSGMVEQTELPIKKKEILVFQTFEDEDAAGLAGDGIDTLNADGEEEMLV